MPSETFAGVSGEVINDYIWAIPPTWTVQNATRLTDSYWSGVSANTGYWYYLGSRSISVTPPVGEGNRRVLAQFYNRFCYETTAYNNLISGMLSSPQSFDFIREPTITVANVPASVKCGEVISFTPTATASQSGSVTFAYSVPANSGWTTFTQKGILYVSSNGSNGTTLTVTPTYTCGTNTFVGTPKNVVIGFNPAQATPQFTVPVVELCPGDSRVVGVYSVPGATSYSFSGITAPLTMVQNNPADRFVRITVPANLTTAVAQTLRVTATSGYGCAPTSGTVVVKAGYGDADLTVYPTPEMVGSRPTVCANSTLNFSLNEYQTIGSSTEIVWTCNNCTIYTDQSSGLTHQISVVAPSGSTSFSVSVNYKDGCGNYHTPLYRNPTYNTSLFTDAYGINGVPCAAPGQQRIAVYPNPAANDLTIEHLRGDVRLYNAQGRLVWQAQVAIGAAARIDTHNLPNGLYYIAGTDDTGHPTRQTVQIQH